MGCEIIKFKTRCLNDRIPESVDEAVEMLFNLLTCRFGRVALKYDDFFDFAAVYFFTLGLYIVNCFGLARWDSKITKELGIDDPEMAAGTILMRLWEKFREECRDVDIESGDEILEEMFEVEVPDELRESKDEIKEATKKYLHIK